MPSFFHQTFMEANKKDINRSLEDDDVFALEYFLDQGFRVDNSYPAKDYLQSVVLHDATRTFNEILNKHHDPRVDLSNLGEYLVQLVLRKNTFPLEKLLFSQKEFGWNFKRRDINQWLQQSLLDGDLEKVLLLQSEKLPTPGSLYDLEDAGVSCLSLASSSGSEDLLKHLLSSGVCFYSSGDGQSPFFQSLRNKNKQTTLFWVNYLYENGLEDRIVPDLILLNDHFGFIHHQSQDQSPKSTLESQAIKIMGQNAIKRVNIVIDALAISEQEGFLKEFRDRSLPLDEFPVIKALSLKKDIQEKIKLPSASNPKKM